MNKVIGHESIIRELENIVASGTNGHAYIFSGTEGIGKMLVAERFARSLICDNPKGLDFCGACEGCYTINVNNNLNIIDSGDESVKVAQIKKLNDEIMIKPIVSKRKIFIINNADMMTEEAQNKLLKTLEEPPLYAVIILVTSNKDKLINTIKSRCNLISFLPLTEENLKTIFKLSNMEIDEDILKYANGSVKVALDIKNGGNISIALKLADAFSTKDLLKVNREMNLLKQDKDLKIYIEDILRYLLVFYSERLNEDIYNVNRIEFVNECINNIGRNANVELALDKLMINMCT